MLNAEICSYLVGSRTLKTQNELSIIHGAAVAIKLNVAKALFSVPFEEMSTTHFPSIGRGGSQPYG